MNDTNQQGEQLLSVLRERAKELGCLYEVEELLEDPDRPLDEVFLGVVAAIPPGWQYPDICCARITHQDMTRESKGFSESPWSMREEIRVQGEPVGTITVYYTEEMPEAGEGFRPRDQTREDASEQRAHRDHIVPPPSPQEHGDSNDEHYEDDDLIEAHSDPPRCFGDSVGRSSTRFFGRGAGHPPFIA